MRKRWLPQGRPGAGHGLPENQVLPKSNASNDLLAMLLVTKYVDGLPLGISLREIARHVGLVPTAFYRHFQDMNEPH